MTEEQKLKKAERDRRYREKKKADKSKEQAMFASPVTGEYITYTETRPGHFVANILTSEADQQAPIDSAPETAFQVSEEQMEKYRQELQPPPVLPEEPKTDFDVLMRRMRRESAR